MSTKQWLAVLAWAFVPFAATAQEKQTQYNPADATAPVSAAAYESAFKDYRAPNNEGETPDKVWRSANDEVGRLGGHVGHVKDGADAPDATNAAPKQGSAADHSKHH